MTIKTYAYGTAAAVSLMLALVNPLPAQTARKMPTTVEAQVRYLMDGDAITQLIVDYGTSFDRKDWALHRSVFTPEIEMDFSASIGAGFTKMKADDWVKSVKPFFEALSGTQHIGMPLSIEIKGDTATAKTMLHAQHYLPNLKGEAVQKMIGSYDMSFVRTAEGWKITKMVQHITWNEGNWYVFLKAAGLAK